MQILLKLIIAHRYEATSLNSSQEVANGQMRAVQNALHLNEQDQVELCLISVFFVNISI